MTKQTGPRKVLSHSEIGSQLCLTTQKADVQLRACLICMTTVGASVSLSRFLCGAGSSVADDKRTIL